METHRCTLRVFGNEESCGIKPVFGLPSIEIGLRELPLFGVVCKGRRIQLQPHFVIDPDAPSAARVVTGPSASRRTCTSSAP